MKNATKTIGLTGNIATGKSVVRRMLANSGALGIDADSLAHRMLYPGGPAYHAAIDAFGEMILSEGHQISRIKLGEIVFSDPGKLAQLESLIHPSVTDSILWRLSRSLCPIIVIEAIKLLEAGLGEISDTLWVSHASEAHQLERLLQTRNITETEARIRIQAQPPQTEKLAKAEVVINTEGPFKSTWQQIQQALNDTIQYHTKLAPQNIKISQGWTAELANHLPDQQLELFWIINTGEEITSLYECLGMQMVLPLAKNDQLVALEVWDNRNFTATLNRVIPNRTLKTFTANVMEAFQTHGTMKQVEILLLPETIVRENDLNPFKFGYQRRLPEELLYPAWRQAAKKITSVDNKHIWVKVLAQPFEMDRKFNYKIEQ